MCREAEGLSGQKGIASPPENGDHPKHCVIIRPSLLVDEKTLVLENGAIEQICPFFDFMWFDFLLECFNGGFNQQNIAKGTTDPRVEFFTNPHHQTHHFKSIPNFSFKILIKLGFKSQQNFTFKILTKIQLQSLDEKFASKS